MKLRLNAKDHNIVEDDFGNPIFKFLGLHPSDRDEIIYRINSNDYVEDLKSRLEEAEDQLWQIRNIL